VFFVEVFLAFSGSHLPEGAFPANHFYREKSDNKEIKEKEGKVII
jgi:hypothetical protein